jgi:hypothetical protein
MIVDRLSEGNLVALLGCGLLLRREGTHSLLSPVHFRHIASKYPFPPMWYLQFYLTFSLLLNSGILSLILSVGGCI